MTNVAHISAGRLRNALSFLFLWISSTLVVMRIRLNSFVSLNPLDVNLPFPPIRSCCVCPTDVDCACVLKSRCDRTLNQSKYAVVCIQIADKNGAKPSGIESENVDNSNCFHSIQLLANDLRNSLCLRFQIVNVRLSKSCQNRHHRSNPFSSTHVIQNEWNTFTPRLKMYSIKISHVIANYLGINSLLIC